MTESTLISKDKGFSGTIDKPPCVDYNAHSEIGDKPACHICGTRRQRNLIISYVKSKHQSIFEYLANPETGDRHVICFRCDSLDLSQDDLRYMKDRYFPGQMRKYKDLKQKMSANQHKRNMGGD